MKDLYVDTVDKLPPNLPKPRGLPIEMNCFVGSDHAGERVNRLFHTGILLYFNSTTIIFYSDRENTVERSTYGLESVAFRISL